MFVANSLNTCPMSMHFDLKVNVPTINRVKWFEIPSESLVDHPRVFDNSNLLEKCMSWNFKRPNKFKTCFVHMHQQRLKTELKKSKRAKQCDSTILSI